MRQLLSTIMLLCVFDSFAQDKPSPTELLNKKNNQFFIENKGQ
jgi:hypothetical protein